MKLYKLNLQGKSIYFNNKEAALNVASAILENFAADMETRMVEKAVEADESGWRGYDTFAIGLEMATVGVEEVDVKIYSSDQVEDIKTQREKEIARLEKKTKK